MNNHIIFIISIMALCHISLALADTQGKGSSDNYEKATFAGGCFWCMEPLFDNLKGVISATSGYTGGQDKNPTYEKVCSGKTGHAEAVQIIYDPSVITYSELLDIFWKNIDPTQENGQFADIGTQYRTAIFYHTREQKKLAEKSKLKLENSGKYGKDIVTKIIPSAEFFKAEDYHQDYYRKNPSQYKSYRYGSGRDQYLEKIWD